MIGTSSDNEDDDTLSSSLQVTRAIQELLRVPSHQSEVQTFFASLFVALLFQISFLVIEGNTVAPDKLPEPEHVDPVRYWALSQCASVLVLVCWCGLQCLGNLTNLALSHPPHLLYYLNTETRSLPRLS